jgi:hypothetical protein
MPSAHAIVVFVLVVMLTSKVQYRNVVNGQTVWRYISLPLSLLKLFDVVRGDLDGVLFIQIVIVEMQVES